MNVLVYVGLNFVTRNRASGGIAAVGTGYNGERTILGNMRGNIFSIQLFAALIRTT